MRIARVAAVIIGSVQNSGVETTQTQFSVRLWNF